MYRIPLTNEEDQNETSDQIVYLQANFYFYIFYEKLQIRLPKE